MDTQDVKAWQRALAALDQEPYDRSHPGLIDLAQSTRIATKRCSHSASTDEIEATMQAVWVHCLLHRQDVAAGLHNAENPANYLAGLVRRVKIDRYRHNQHDALGHLQKDPESDIDLPAEDLLAAIDRHEDLAAVLASLPDADQSILRRYYLDEERASRIAADLDVTIDTLYKRLERARTRMAQRLESSPAGCS